MFSNPSGCFLKTRHCVETAKKQQDRLLYLVNLKAVGHRAQMIVFDNLLTLRNGVNESANSETRTLTCWFWDFTCEKGIYIYRDNSDRFDLYLMAHADKAYQTSRIMNLQGSPFVLRLYFTERHVTEMYRWQSSCIYCQDARTCHKASFLDRQAA